MRCVCNPVHFSLIQVQGTSLVAKLSTSAVQGSLCGGPRNAPRHLSHENIENFNLRFTLSDIATWFGSSIFLLCFVFDTHFQ